MDGRHSPTDAETHPDFRGRQPQERTTRQVRSLAAGETFDQLRDRVEAVGDRQEALLDEALEETFPGSDPISPSRLS